MTIRQLLRIVLKIVTCAVGGTLTGAVLGEVFQPNDDTLIAVFFFNCHILRHCLGYRTQKGSASVYRLSCGRRRVGRNICGYPAKPKRTYSSYFARFVSRNRLRTRRCRRIPLKVKSNPS